MTTQKQDTNQQNVNNDGTRDVISMNAGEKYLGIKVANQLLGLPLRRVDDILDWQNVTWVPGAPAPIRGLINLRGNIVSAIDLRQRLQAGEPLAKEYVMHVVVNTASESYSLVVDDVSEIRALDPSQREPTPTTINATWQDVTKGVFRVGEKHEQLMLIADIDKIVDMDVIRNWSNAA